MPRIVMLLTLLAALLGLWFGLDADSQSIREAASEAVCQAVDAERYDQAIAQSQALVGTDWAGRRAAECRCWALLNRDRRDECAQQVDALLVSDPEAGWVPHPVLSALVTRQRMDQGRTAEAASLAGAAAAEHPQDLQLLELEIQARSAFEGERVAHQAIESRLGAGLAWLPLRIALAASYLARFEAAQALRVLADVAPPAGHPLGLLWFENRARAIAMLGEIAALKRHFERWAASGADPVDLRARYALRVSVSHLRDPEKTHLALLEEALVDPAQLHDGQLRWALYRRLIGTLVADARIEDALSVYDEAVKYVAFPKLDREQIERAALPALAAENAQDVHEGILHFALAPDAEIQGTLLVAPDPREPADREYEVHAITSASGVRVHRVRSYTPTRWVLRDEQGRTRGSGMAWPHPGREVRVRIEPRAVLDRFSQGVKAPSRPADGHRRLYTLILDCADWRLTQYLRARGELPLLDHLMRSGYRAVLSSQPAFTAAAMEALVWPDRGQEVSFVGLMHRMGLEIGGLASVGKNPLGFLAAVLPESESLFERLGAGELVTANMLFSHGGIEAGHHAQILGPFSEARRLELSRSFRPLRDEERSRFPGLDMGPRQRRHMETIAAEFDTAQQIIERGEVDLLMLRIEPLDLLTHAFFGDLLKGGQDDGKSPLLAAYRYIDHRLVTLYGQMDADDVLLVMSDHGIRTPMEHEEDALFVLAGAGIPRGRAPGQPHLRGVPRILAGLLGVETPWPDSGVASWIASLVHPAARVASAEAPEVDLAD